MAKGEAITFDGKDVLVTPNGSRQGPPSAKPLLLELAASSRCVPTRQSRDVLVLEAAASLGQKLLGNLQNHAFQRSLLSTGHCGRLSQSCLVPAVMVAFPQAAPELLHLRVEMGSCTY